ncbi:hypothetical protein [Vitiosangium sp. GDMCC 1.1324]|uniref:hypothetical protein n=1 Tax=Vitiosangium sp. (strain GDMCC 1.1324) TaxID=2138576 RepID=UPI000D3B8BB7|nr:hypothetical protein [Vitiosangium sp. GDMCC 1.1324]PTL82966.1 hypothetical protein DAT35_13150 [Vitiosangium sp. GDMCC 1.1324]
MLRSALLLGLVVLFFTTACVSFVGGDGGGGGISPLQFMFEPYVPPDALEPGGWKAARVIINLVRKSDEGLRMVPCQVQVEVPEVNRFGPVTDEFAQQEAAKAADAAVERVLPQGLVSAAMCLRFYEEMRKILESSIPGARVRRFIDMKGNAP